MKSYSLFWLIGSLIVPVILVVLAKFLFDIDEAEFFSLMQLLSESSWAIPVTIALFCGLAFIGAPQWMLITGTVLAFGVWEGGALSWFASLASAILGFAIGHGLGAERLERVDAKLVQKLTTAVRKNGFMTSLVVRLVPTGPAILVNLAAGVSRMKFRHFAAGTAVGIIPKILIICLISQGLISGLSGSLIAVFFAGLAIAAILLSWVARKRLEACSDV